VKAGGTSIGSPFIAGVYALAGNSGSVVAGSYPTDTAARSTRWCRAATTSSATATSARRDRAPATTVPRGWALPTAPERSSSARPRVANRAVTTPPRAAAAGGTGGICSHAGAHARSHRRAALERSRPDHPGPRTGEALRRHRGGPRIDLEVRRGEIFDSSVPTAPAVDHHLDPLHPAQGERGSATVAGHDVARDPHAVRQSIGLIFQDPSLDDQLTARENLQFHALVYGVRAPGGAAASTTRCAPSSFWSARSRRCAPSRAACAAAGDRSRHPPHPRGALPRRAHPGTGSAARANSGSTCSGCAASATSPCS